MTIAITHKGIGHLMQSITAGATTMNIPAIEAQAFTNVNGDYIYAILRSATAREIVRIDIAASQFTNGILTVARGQGGSIAAAWPAGTLVLAVTNADHYNSLIQAGASRTISYNPNEVLNPLYRGEKVYQNGPAGCERWWKAFNAVNPYWDIITGVACGSEIYQDIGWDYELLLAVLVPLVWALKKDLGNETPSQDLVLCAVHDPNHDTQVDPQDYSWHLL
jgi:hypothetical protein